MTEPLTFAQFQASRRLPALDGLRAVAVLLVVSWHVGPAFEALHGNQGVSIFFVLSGFLITTLALREERAMGRFAYGPFLVRRFFRIAPLLWLGVAAYAVLVLVLKLDDRRDAFVHAVPYYLGYFPEYPLFATGTVYANGDGAVPFSGIWSIGIEEKFYLVWPLVAFWVMRGRRGRAALAAGVAASLWVWAGFSDAHLLRFTTPYAPIFVGCALAVLLSTPRGYAELTRATTPFGTAAVVLGLGVGLYASGSSPVLQAAIAVLAAVLVAAVVTRPTTRLAALLSSRVAARLGLLSYALYLFHSLALKVVEKAVTPDGSVPTAALTMALALALAVPACEVLHRCVERPCQNLGRRLAERLAHRPEPAAGRLPAASRG